ncbi:MAG TPA: ATP-dependent 6-phosphofructokinase [Anaerolineales bacterium]|nr:ATP-dependent 6-phosphofructokinase [Anaerolineales bacterium]
MPTQKTTNNKIKRIAISTGGGDAPGLNAVIRAVTLSGLKRGWEVYGIRDGFHGILLPEQYEEGGMTKLTMEKVRGITHLGGTILGTSNRNNPMSYPIKLSDGTIEEVDRTGEIVRNLRLHHIDALISVGGDGSLAISDALSKKGLRVIHVPKTIDNDLDKTDATFGFDTAVGFATESIDRLHSTAASHGRVMVVEVMGRYAGWIALHSGVAGSADAILIPEIPYDIRKVAEKVRDRDRIGRHYTIVIVAEGAKPAGGSVIVQEHKIGKDERLGGIGEQVAKEIRSITDKETRVVVLGHLLRGGTPTSLDRLYALRFGAAAVRALDDGQDGIMVALDPPKVKYVPISEAMGQMKYVPVNSDTVLTARDLGITFADADAE